MELKDIKWKLSILWKKAVEMKDKTITFASEQISKSALIIDTQDELNNFISQSENKIYKTDSWEEKIFTKRVILIIWDWKKDFFKDLILKLPLILAKTFSQNLKLKLIDVNNLNIDLKIFELNELPAVIIFENKEIYKKFNWEEKLNKIISDLTLDINKTIDEIA